MGNNFPWIPRVFQLENSYCKGFDPCFTQPIEHWAILLFSENSHLISNLLLIIAAICVFSISIFSPNILTLNPVFLVSEMISYSSRILLDICTVYYEYIYKKSSPTWQLSEQRYVLSFVIINAVKPEDLSTRFTIFPYTMTWSHSFSIFFLL